MKAVLSITTLLSLVLSAKAANLTLVQEYSGSSFFDKWDFYGDTTAGLNGPWAAPPYDDTTNGDVFYMGRSNGSSLYHVDDTTGHAFIKVDNTSFVDYNQKRDSIRITTQDSFNYGTVWVIDVYHLPWGCSVWPGIWTKGPNWPNDGEIDIVEGVNKITQNQMALHTLPGCNASPGTNETGQAGTADCSPQSGCTVLEKKPGSYGPDFESNGGGVWATWFDLSGVFIWFWSRADVPASITTATDSIDISSWGPPSAAYLSSTCDIAKYFGPQQLVIDITLCGDWGRQASIYADTCNDTPQQTDPNQRCYVDNVINNGTADYVMAYFEIGSIRAFSSNATAPTTGSSVTPGSTVSGGSKSGSPTATGSGAGSSTTTTGNTNAGAVISPSFIGFITLVFSVFSWIML